MGYSAVYITVSIWLLITCTSLSKSTLVCYDCNSCNGRGDVTLPYNIAAIKYGSFNNCTSLVKVSIPSHIERIEALSFALCPNLSAVNLAEGLKLIDFRAFYGSGITDIIIPSTVTYISEGAFSNCLNLKCSGISFTKSVSNSDRLPVFIDENFLGTDEESRDCQKSLQQSLLADSIPSHHRKLLAGKTGRPNLEVEIQSATFGKRADPVGNANSKKKGKKAEPAEGSRYSPFLKLKLKVSNPSQTKDFVVYPQELTTSPFSGRKAYQSIYQIDFQMVDKKKVFLSGSRSEYCIKDTVHPMRFTCAKMGLSPGNHYFSKASLNLSAVADYLIPSFNYTVTVTVTPYNTHTDSNYKPHSQQVTVAYSPKKKEKE